MFAKVFPFFFFRKIFFTLESFLTTRFSRSRNILICVLRKLLCIYQGPNISIVLLSPQQNTVGKFDNVERIFLMTAMLVNLIKLKLHKQSMKQKRHFYLKFHFDNFISFPNVILRFKRKHKPPHFFLSLRTFVSVIGGFIPG